jgi:gluconokinase
MDEYPLAWIVSGVSGSGKTTIGRLFANHLEADFLEGDRRHSTTNIRKMIEQIPLQDLQRSIDHNREVVMTCSALKRSYRRQLTALGRVQLVLLDASAEVLRERLEQRNHYMKPEMIDSQIQSFEPISPEENAIVIDANGALDKVLNELIKKANEKFPVIKKPWWQR